MDLRVGSEKNRVGDPGTPVTELGYRLSPVSDEWVFNQYEVAPRKFVLYMLAYRGFLLHCFKKS